MRNQRSLFAAVEEPRAPPSRPRSIRKEDFAFCPLKSPCGIPDKRGKFQYEKFHRQAVGISDTARVKFFEILLVTDATLFSRMIEIGVLWNRLSVSDQLDYEDSIRLRG